MKLFALASPRGCWAGKTETGKAKTISTMNRKGTGGHSWGEGRWERANWCQTMECLDLVMPEVPVQLDFSV